MNIEDILDKYYGMTLIKSSKFEVGAGSDTYYTQTNKGEYILKSPSTSEINNPENECELCSFLIENGIQASEFIKNLDDQYITVVDNRIFHLQKFFHGTTYDLNDVPEWLLTEMAATLGKIHRVLKDYKPLPVGIGEDFFKYMTPENARNSYEQSLKTATDKGDTSVVKDLEYRIELMENFPLKPIDIYDFTCGNSHGDYFISQIITGDNKINAVIDWTSACRHPYVWEIIRSYIYADPCCRNGIINEDNLKRYIDTYSKYNELSSVDLKRMKELFFYQIAVCDYYGQYYGSDANNRELYLHQAEFSTKVMKNIRIGWGS